MFGIFCTYWVLFYYDFKSVSTVATMMLIVLWDVTPSSLVNVY